MQATSEDETTLFDLLDIPIHGIEELDELNDCLSQPIEKVHNQIWWWWDHRSVYLKLSQMVFDFLSIPGAFFLSQVGLKLTHSVTHVTPYAWVQAQFPFLEPSAILHLLPW
jgi:hypothetical protein